MTAAAVPHTKAKPLFDFTRIVNFSHTDIACPVAVERLPSVGTHGDGFRL
jgi:hypothetical protein